MLPPWKRERQFVCHAVECARRQGENEDRNGGNMGKSY